MTLDELCKMLIDEINTKYRTYGYGKDTLCIIANGVRFSVRLSDGMWELCDRKVTDERQPIKVATIEFMNRCVINGSTLSTLAMFVHLSKLDESGLYHFLLKCFAPSQILRIQSDPLNFLSYDTRAYDSTTNLFIREYAKSLL